MLNEHSLYFFFHLNIKLFTILTSIYWQRGVLGGGSCMLLPETYILLSYTTTPGVLPATIYNVLVHSTDKNPGATWVQSVINV